MNSEVIDAMRQMDEPILTLGEIADEMGKSKGAVGTRLGELHESGDVRRKKVGARAVVWWLPERTKEVLPGEKGFITASERGET